MYDLSTDTLSSYRTQDSCPHWFTAYCYRTPNKIRMVMLLLSILLKWI